MTKPMHITPADGNVFADLGFEPGEAAALKAESQRIISERLAIKNSLMTALAEWLDAKKLNQAEAAAVLGVTGARVSDVFNRNANKFTIDALVDMLARAGKRVVFSVE